MVSRKQIVFHVVERMMVKIKHGNSRILSSSRTAPISSKISVVSLKHPLPSLPSSVVKQMHYKQQLLSCVSLSKQAVNALIIWFKLSIIFLKPWKECVKV
jgi:hypothetical protein